MSETSVRLALPYLQPSQAQKYVTHNEALQRLDLLVQLVVEMFDALVPPSLPEEGQVWALGATPGGEWAGQAHTLAAWASGGWIHVSPQEGWRAYGRADGSLRVWDGADWVAPQDAQVQTQLGINTTADATNRLALSSPAALFTHEGAGHQLKVNKASAADTASLLFQTGFSGRAEMGTAGDDNFAVKVSADGSSWANALIADAASGQITLPNGLVVQGALTLPNASVTRAALANSTALSLIGRASSTDGVPADIVAGSDHQVLRRSGTSLGFGALNLAQAAAVTGALAVANGGTGGTTQATARTGLGLGTAATAAVTTSNTDTTAGRVPTVGWMGLGVNNDTPPVITDFAVSRASGLYRWVGGGATANRPPDADGWWYSALLMRTTAGQSFLAMRAQQNAAPILHLGRSDSDGTNVQWTTAYTRANVLGTVSQTGGVPTGAVIERGSNANGEYVRFADGTQICWSSTLSFGAVNTAVGSGFRSDDLVWTFPASFFDSSKIAVSGQASNFARWMTFVLPGATSVSLRLSAWTSFAGSENGRAIAIGRWF